MSLFRYSGLSTKVKAMRGRLLSQEQFREMSDLHSVPEVLSYLKKIPTRRHWGTGMKRICTEVRQKRWLSSPFIMISASYIALLIWNKEYFWMITL